MRKLNARQLVNMCNGTASEVFADSDISSVVIDSRKVSDGSLFIAIVGENHDAHDYVAQVIARGNTYALVNADFALNLPNLIRVKDTTQALGILASNYRQLFTIPLVAITGSNGKTTVKEMLRCVCQTYFGADHVLATSGNLNNHWGMPLTLLELNDSHKIAIIEMGMNHAGELDYLSKLAKPTLAVVNNVMFAHIGQFKSLAEIADAKGEIYNGLASGGVACIDVSSPFSAQWSAILNQIHHTGSLIYSSLTASKLRRKPSASISNLSEYKTELATTKIFNYGTVESGCYLAEFTETGARYITPLGELEINLRILGQHNYFNALTVIALAINLGCSLNSIKTGLENYTGYSGRLERKKAFNDALIVDDTYNANPDSVRAALKAISVLPRPHWFIFADLKELGSGELDFHREIGEQIQKDEIDRLLTVGNLAAHAAKYFNGAKIHFESNQDIVKYCLSELPKSGTLLIKGSHSMRLNEVADQLTTLPW